MEDLIFVVENGNVTLTTENVGFIGPLQSCVAALLIDDEIRQSYIAGVNLYPALARLNNAWQHSVPGWKWCCSAKYRTAQYLKQVRGKFYVEYIAIDRRPARGRQRNRIDIINLDLIYDHPPVAAVDQLLAARHIIELQRARGLTKIKTTRGSIGAALIKQSPNWKKGRYAAPREANKVAREYLPGNYYAVSSRIQKLHPLAHCFYIDQESAHHNIALTCPAPDPQSIRARGNWKDAIAGKDYYKAWIPNSSSLANCLIDNHSPGLVLAKVGIGTLPPTKKHLYPPWAQKSGSKYIWLWTPELRLFKDDHRLQLDSFIAGFTGYVKDSVLPEYARWSLDYLKSHPEQRRYIKTLLLAAYGMLAFNQEKYNTIHKFWGGDVSGPQVTLPEAGRVAERKIQLPLSRPQHNLTNVIARGLIEAETRTRSLEYAKELDNQGFHVAQIYVDGLLVEVDEIPIPPTGWSISHSITNVAIPRSNAFSSDQLVKYPGIPLTEDEYNWQQRREDARKPLTVGV